MFGLSRFLSSQWPEVITFLMVLGRTSGLMMAAPFWGGRVVPGLIKIVLSTGLSVAIYPLVKTAAAPAGQATGVSMVFLVLALGGEILLGFSLGWSAQVLFSGMRLAGHQIETRMGLSMASLIDPHAGGPTAIFSLMLDLMGTIAFFALNGHHILVHALASSYTFFPLASARLDLFPALVNSAAGIFAIGLQVSAPVVVGLVLSDIVLGVVNRVIPQMNVFLVALPLQFFFGMLLLLFSLPLVGWLLSDRLAAIGSELSARGSVAAGGR
ncbi:MAG: flagellar biosynthetic protein FliR [Deltaproteobacteria bacterium]|nr:flagellar biosynthetic protein FliR [Deltaproteobacteria bacterium]